jgi:hypothetical protein
MKAFPRVGGTKSKNWVGGNRVARVNLFPVCLSHFEVETAKACSSVHADILVDDQLRMYAAQFCSVLAQLLLISLCCSVRYQKLQINCNETSISFHSFLKAKRRALSNAFIKCILQLQSEPNSQWCRHPGVLVVRYRYSSPRLYSPFPFFLLFPLFYSPHWAVFATRVFQRRF